MMSLKSLSRKIPIYAIYFYTLIIITSCGGSDSEIPVEDTATAEVRITENTKILESSSVQEISDITVEGDIVNQVSDGKATIIVTESSNNSTLSVGDNIWISPDEDDRYPIGLAGKIESVSSDGQGNNKLILAPANLSDIVKESKTGTQSFPLSAESFVGIISPDAVLTASENNTANRKAYVPGAKYALNGAIEILPKDIIKSKSFLGDSGDIDIGGSISVSPLCILLDKMVDEGTSIRPNNVNEIAKVCLSAKFNKLNLSEEHDFSITEGLKSLDFKISGDMEFKAELLANASFSLGVFNRHLS